MIYNNSHIVQYVQLVDKKGPPAGEPLYVFACSLRGVADPVNPNGTGLVALSKAWSSLAEKGLELCVGHLDPNECCFQFAWLLNESPPSTSS
jgi:hypothetical protein